MRYLLGLIAAAFILFSGTMAFSSGNKDGAAVVTFFDDPRQVKYYINDINSSNGSRSINCGVADTTMDNVKINSVFGDIKIASHYTLILNNKTTDRLVFDILWNNNNKCDLIIKGAFILKDKKSNKIIGDKSNVRTLRFSLNDNKVKFENSTYNRKDLAINTMDGATVSIDGYYKQPNPGGEICTIAIHKGKYECKTVFYDGAGLNLHFGLTGQSSN